MSRPASKALPWTALRRAAVEAAEAAGHQKIAPRDPEATLDEVARWCVSRHALAREDGDATLARAILAYVVSEPELSATTWRAYTRWRGAMLEMWLEELGAKIVVSIHDRLSSGSGEQGNAEFGPEREDEFSGEHHVPRAGLNALRLRYTWETIQIGWNPTFDRWANSVDWCAKVPSSKEDLAWILAEAVRRGDAGDRCEVHGYQETEIVPGQPADLDEVRRARRAYDLRP